MVIKSLFINSLDKALEAGNSFKQGAHHDAQKSIKTYLPFKAVKDTSSLCNDLIVKSGAGFPIAERASLSLRLISCCSLVTRSLSARTSFVVFSFSSFAPPWRLCAFAV